MTSSMGDTKLVKKRQTATPPRRVLNRGKNSKKTQGTASQRSNNQKTITEKRALPTTPVSDKSAIEVKDRGAENEQKIEIRVVSVSCPATGGVNNTATENEAADTRSGASWSPKATSDDGTASRAALEVRNSSSSVGLSKLVATLMEPMATVEDGRAACVKIADLCTAGTRRNKLVQDALFSAGAVEALVHVIGSTVDERVQQLATLALGCLCELHPDSQNKARRLGGVQLLFDLLKDGSDASKEVASTTLIHLTDIPTPTEGDVDLGTAVSVLIDLIKTEAYQQTPTCENCTWVLGNLSCSPLTHHVIRESGGIPALLYLLEKSAAQRNYMLEYRTVWCLCNLASSKACQNEIRTCNGIPLLSAQLTTEVSEQSERSWERIKVSQVVAHILSNLAVEPINQQELLDAGVVPVLLKMLEVSGDSKVKLMSGWALSNLASNPRTHSTIVRCNGPAIFTKILSHHRQSHWLALRMVVALGNLACDSPENRELIREAGAIGLLVYCLTDEHADVCERSLIALENLSTKSHANQLEIARAGAIPHLVAVMAQRQEGLAVEKAVGTVYNLACSGENVNMIWNCGAVPVLEALLAGSVDPALQLRNSVKSLPDGPRTELQDRAQLALEKLVPSRGQILPESKRQTPTPATPPAPASGFRARLASMSAKLAKVRLREHWSKGVGRLGRSFRRTLSLTRRATSGSRRGGEAAEGNQIDEDAIRRATEEALPTWDASFVTCNSGVAGDPNMKVYNVHEMIANCRTPRATHDGCMATTPVVTIDTAASSTAQTSTISPALRQQSTTASQSESEQ